MRSEALFSAKKVLAFYLGVVFIINGCSGGPVEKETTTNPPQKSTDTVQLPPSKLDTVPVPDTLHWYVYLTFDDGPQHGTSNCLQICREEQVKASFFMVGMHCEQWQLGKWKVDTIRNSYPQFLLANHSYSHARERYRYFYHHPDSALTDFLQAENILQPTYRIARLPGNNAWNIQHNQRSTHLVAPVLHKLDSISYDVIGWDQEWNFRHTNSRPVEMPEKLAAQTLNLLKKRETRVPRHLVLLMHDRMFAKSEDSAFLRSYIQLLKSEPGMVFETIDHYPGVSKISPASVHQF